jgi:hypothetical protein
MMGEWREIYDKWRKIRVDRALELAEEIAGGDELKIQNILLDVEKICRRIDCATSNEGEANKEVAKHIAIYALGVLDGRKSAAPVACPLWFARAIDTDECKHFKGCPADEAGIVRPQRALTWDEEILMMAEFGEAEMEKGAAR